MRFSSQFHFSLLQHPQRVISLLFWYCIMSSRQLEWCQDILQGIELVHKGGGVPGTLIAFGENAEPILTGDTAFELILTASEYGKGRIAVFSHNMYIDGLIENLEKFARLNSNIKRWLSKNSSCSESQVLHIKRNTREEDLSGEKKIYIWDCKPLEKDFIELMLSKVFNGGVGLVLGMCPWGWRQLNGDRSLDEAPFHPVLLAAGVCFTSEYVRSGDDGGFKTCTNQASNAHFGRVLQQVILDGNAWESHQDFLCETLPVLPCTVLVTLRGKLDQLLNAFPIPATPSSSQPVTDAKVKSIIALHILFLKAGLLGNAKAPGIEKFPGDFSSPPTLEIVDVAVSGCYGHELRSTGFYLPSGQVVKVTVLQGDAAAWSVQVGAHTDNIMTCEEWRRYPIVTMTKSLRKGAIEFSSPFGGLVYLKNNNKEDNMSISVHLENVVLAPWFDIKDPQLCKQWSSRRLAPGLWAELAGENIIFTVPSESVRHLHWPRDVLSLWDRVVSAHHHLKGTDPSKCKRERFVCDEQPVVGYMHSGYPIVTHLDIADPSNKEFLLNHEELQKGFWGPFHELGHNMQEGSWTFDGTVEVTCNIFTLHAMDVVSGQKPWIHTWLRDQLKGAQKYLTNGAVFEAWKQNPGVGLCIYAQLVHTFGWDSYKAVFRRYRDEDLSPKDNQKKIDTWVVTFSEVVQRNLCPLFDFWGIPISKNVKDELSRLKPFLPSDEMMALAPERTAMIRSQYGLPVGGEGK